MNHRLRLKILERFFSQADFAQAIGEAESKISNVVRGRRQLRPEEKDKWAAALEADPQELFGTAA